MTSLDYHTLTLLERYTSNTSSKQEAKEIVNHLKKNPEWVELLTFFLDFQENSQVFGRILFKEELQKIEPTSKKILF